MNTVPLKLAHFFKNRLNFLQIFKSGYKPFDNIYSTPWPGNPEKAYSLLRGYLIVHEVPISMTDVMNILMQDNCLQAKENVYVHGFSWLKDLRSMNENAVRRIARKIILQWIDHNKKIKIRQKNKNIDFAVMGERIANWIIFFEFFGASADDMFLENFYKNVYYQISLLEVYQRKIKDSSVLGIGLKGLVLFYIATNSLQKLQPALDAFINACKKQLLPDGSHISCDPLMHFNLLKDVLDIRSALRNANIDGGEILRHITQKMVPILRFSRLGDGRLISYKNVDHQQLLSLHNAPSSQHIDMVLSIADVKGRQLVKAPDMGFERVNSKTSQLFLNIQPRNDDMEKFYGPGTGILNFEWNYAEHRIVSKGDIVIQTTKDEWLHCQKGHDIPQVLHIDRKAKDGQYLLEADFESVLKKQNTTLLKDVNSYVFHHHRQLFLGDEDGDFRGKDRFLLSTNALCAIRFVFPKGISISLMKSSKIHTALVKIHEEKNSSLHEIPAKKTKNTKEKLWRFICQNAEELSIHYDDDTKENALIVLVRLYDNKPTVVKWGFRLVQ